MSIIRRVTGYVEQTLSRILRRSASRDVGIIYVGEGKKIRIVLESEVIKTISSSEAKEIVEVSTALAPSDRD